MKNETTYPNPDDTNPATRDCLDLGEAPVAVRSNDRRDELRDAEGTHEGERRALHEEEAVRARDEDEGLRDDGDLKVDDGVELGVVVAGRRGREAAGEGDTELVVEPSRLDDDRDERNAKNDEVRARNKNGKRKQTHVDTVR